MASLRLRAAFGVAAAVAACALTLAQGCANGTTNAPDSGACNSPDITCGSACVNPSVDSNNCGACGTVCTGGQVCSQGKCGSSCAQGTLCTPDGGKPFCALTDSDPKNCGACGNVCGGSSSCTAGKCSGGGCPQGQTSCPGDGGAICVDTQTDKNHCGTCTTSCISGLEICTEGACAPTCPAGQTLCVPDGGAGDGGPVAHCADLQVSNTDCGACFNGCGGGAQCQSGKCVATLLGSGTAADPWHTSTALANCADYKKTFPNATDGVYTTHPSTKDIGVYCDMTNGGLTYEDFGFGQFSAAYTGYTILAVGDFSNKAQLDAAFAYLYTRNGGLTNINPGGWTDGNCCIENGTTTSSFLGLAGSTYMYPAVNGVSNCNTTYSAAIIQLQLQTSGTVLTTFTSAQAGQATTSSTCSTSGNPAIFVKRY